MKHIIDIHADEEDNGWIVTFADLVTLLLVFFILLFSVSTIKEESFEETVDSVKKALNRTGQGSDAGAGAGTKDEKDSKKVETGNVATDSLDPSEESGEQQQAPTELELPVIATPFSPTPSKPDNSEAIREAKQKMSQVSGEVKQLLANTAQPDDAKLSPIKENKIIINVRGDMFFNAGSAQFKREAMPIMDGIGNILRKNPEFKLAVGGHTDNTPISTNRYPSNWELSAIRATTVLRYFVRGGMNPDRVTATGYGESTPITANESEEQRAQNRRIEFVLERITP